MYLIEWKENGETKTFVAESYIERDVVIEKLKENDIEPKCTVI